MKLLNDSLELLVLAFILCVLFGYMASAADRVSPGALSMEAINLKQLSQSVELPFDAMTSSWKLASEASKLQDCRKAEGDCAPQIGKVVEAWHGVDRFFSGTAVDYPYLFAQYRKVRDAVIAETGYQSEPEPSEYRIASGLLDLLPVSFQGYTRAEVRGECLDYMWRRGVRRVHRLTINGKVYFSTRVGMPAFYSCSLVAAEARR